MGESLLGLGGGALLTLADGTAISLGGDGSAYTADNFAAEFLALLPSGRVWPRDPDAVIPQVAARLALTCERLAASAAGLLQDSPAGTLDQMLPDWEASLGLPDPCAGVAPTLLQRRLSVAAQLAARGGQSAAYFESLVAALGRPCTVQCYAPARAGLLSVGDPLYGAEWAFAWLVTIGPPADPGNGADNAVVECVLRRFAPAHTVLITQYNG